MKIGELKERNIAKECLIEALNQEFDKMIEFGVLIELQEDTKR